MLLSCGQSDIGQRKINEDSFLINEDLGLYIVADGVGGLAKGEIASKVACEAVMQNIQAGMPLEESVYLAHRSIVNEIKSDDQKNGMATTIVAVLFNKNIYEVAWVGDSRLYLWDGRLKLLTKDDSYVELLLENGHIGVDELDTHPDRNVISQALGIERKNIIINTNAGTLEQGQILLLCSDGLYGIANEMDIIESLQSGKTVADITPDLVSLAVKKEGKDNITLLSISSDTDSNTKIQARVYREFDLETGKIIERGNETHFPTTQSQEDSQTPQEAETDPELIDQTAYRDLTEEHRNLLDSAAELNSPEESPNKYLIPALLVSILVIAGLLLLK